VWLGAAVAALGWVLSALVVARGGGYAVVMSHLSVVLPLAAVGTLTALASSRVGRPSATALTWLLAALAFGFFWNVLIYWLRFGGETWGLLIPLARPTGLDFRDGLYEPARAFTTATSGWPPLTLLLGKPFTLVGFSTAHAVEVVLLAAAAAAAVVLSAVLAAQVTRGPALEAVPGGSRPGDPAIGGTGAPAIGLVAGLWLFTSVGFLYEMERGNIDLFALLFALLAVWLMLRLPRSPWWPALALAVAINLKLYPGVLLVLLLWRYRRRAVLPALVTNAVLLLIAGPANVVHTIEGQVAVEGVAEAYWWGNHSAAALATVLRGLSVAWPSWVFWPLLIVPVLLWLATLALLVRRGWSARRAVLAAAACVPVMSVAPGISHDYKLVICVLPVAVLAAALSALQGRGSLTWALLFGLAAWAFVALARASLVVAPSLQASKYLMIVLLQVLLLAVVLLMENGPVDETPGRGPAGTAPPGPAEEGTT